MKNKFKVAVAIISLGITGIASAANTCPVKVTQPNDEVSQHIKALINGENVISNNSAEVKHIELPDITVGNVSIDQITGGFSFTPDSDLVAKAIVKPNLKNVSNLLLYRKTLAYVSKLNLGQLRAYAQGILDYQAQNPSNTAESESLASFAHGVIDHYNIFLKVASDKPLTDREKVIANQTNYPVVALASAFSKDNVRKNDLVTSDDGIYKGIADNSCNYSSGCNETIRTANALMVAQAFDGYSTALKQSIMQGSLPYAINLGLLNKHPNSYQALQDTEMNAYQKAQLAMLTDIDQQLRKLNSN